MDIVFKPILLYAFLFLLFRLTGKRSLGQITTFDFILLLIIGESVQQGLVGRDYSMVGAMGFVTVLVFIDVALSLINRQFPWAAKWLEGTPLVIVADGKLLEGRMKMERVDESDIIAAARATQGLEKLEQIKFAVLERDGSISIIPRERK
jgi:uncharacterized membrane protein YcaP (DUF421 family)